MRINTVNEKYIMIKAEEISNFALGQENLLEEKVNFSINAYNGLKDYYFKTNKVPSEIAVSINSEISKILLENIDKIISIKDIHNSFMYAVMTDDIEKINILQELLKQHEEKSIDDLKRIYGEDLILYIRKNKDYDYIENINIINEKDSNILLFDGEKLSSINLQDNKLILQNKI